MTIEELEALITQSEGQQLEFKRSLAELETAIRTLAAFANTGGTQYRIPRPGRFDED